MRWKMILTKLSVLSMVISVSHSSLAASPATWQKTGTGIDDPSVLKVAADARDPSLIFAATAHTLYKSSDGGGHYRAVFHDSGINGIYADSPKVFVAGDAGLYVSADAGGHWQRIYSSSDEDARVCRSVIEQDGIFYLGTAKGFWTKPVNGGSWRRAEGELGQARIEHIKGTGGKIYVATENAVFLWDRTTGAYARVFSSGFRQGQEADGDFEEGTGTAAGVIHAVEISGGDILVASSWGIYASADEGRRWRRLPSEGIPLQDLTALMGTDNALTSGGQDQGRPALKSPGLLVGTKKGAFLFKDGGWRPIYEGMETNRISHLAKDARNTVYAATDRGVFHLALKEALPSLLSDAQASGVDAPRAADFSGLQGLLDAEPSIGEVHHFAIEYAEVDPEKITRWRRLAQRRAWLPDVSLGVDGARDWSKSSSIWGSYTSGGQHYVGPDDKARGGDLGWDVSLSWDLGDVVWSSEQTSIDSRSKLMVELREDILDQVTRVYFERRRIQAELAAAGTMEPWIKMDKQLRVDELTALLDAFTGGQFSRRMQGAVRKN